MSDAREKAMLEADQVAHDMIGGRYGPSEIAEKIIAAYEAALWQPIETAPAVCPILVYVDDDHPVMQAAYWMDQWMSSGKQVFPTLWRSMPEPPAQQGGE